MKSTTGNSVPPLLMTPGTILMKCHVCNGLYDSLGKEVELIESNPEYACVRHAEGRESTVSRRHLSPCGEFKVNQHHVSPADRNENRETAA